MNGPPLDHHGVLTDSAVVRLVPGEPDERADANTLVVTPDGPLSAGLDGLREMVSMLEERSPGPVARIARDNSPEWNVLFPGRFPDAPSLAVLAATCSERRLHAECEQVFRVTLAAARALTAAADEHPVTVVFRDAGRLDLPTLRAFPALVERIRMTGSPARIVLGGFRLAARPSGPGGAQRQAVRERTLRALAERLDAPAPEPGPGLPSAPGARPPCRERSWIDALSSARRTEDAVVAALGTMRAAFFSTQHETGLYAAHRLLDELHANPDPDVDAVVAAMREADLGDDPGSVGIDAAAVVDAGSLVSLAHRYIAVLHAYVMDHRTALDHLAEAARHGPATVRSRAHLLAALLLIKRVDRVGDGFDEADAGLAELAGDVSTTGAVETAWLHNVRALGHVQRRELDPALEEERRAIELIGRLTTTDATHLKVNLVSNVSVLREYGRRPRAALRVWRRFSRDGAQWGDTFFKHHLYREAGLLIGAGAVDEALPLLDRCYRLAGDAGDDFYRAHMALERGRLLLDTAPPTTAAAAAFALARDHAGALGDPYLAALATAGGALATGGLDAAARDEVAGLAALSCSHPGPVAALLSALAGGSDDEVLACLSRPRTKLNRPFHTVRLELPERR